jgi:hypothetical protein
VHHVAIVAGYNAAMTEGRPLNSGSSGSRSIFCMNKTLIFIGEEVKQQLCWSEFDAAVNMVHHVIYIHVSLLVASFDILAC